MAQDREASAAAGMDDFVPKPIVAADLEAALRRVATSRRRTSSS